MIPEDQNYKTATNLSVRDLELHCQQLQVLLQQLRTEKEFVEKENLQLRDVMTELAPAEAVGAGSAKVSVWLDRERTCQAEVQLSESDDIVAVAAAVSRAHSLDDREAGALLQQWHITLEEATSW